MRREDIDYCVYMDYEECITLDFEKYPNRLYGEMTHLDKYILHALKIVKDTNLCGDYLDNLNK